MEQQTLGQPGNSHSANLPVMGSVSRQITVMYVYADAFFKCDCGEDMMASQRAFGDMRYTGRCKCGTGWTINNGKISRTAWGKHCP